LARLLTRHNKFGDAYLQLARNDEAEKAFQKAKSLEDESCASCGLGVAYWKLGRYVDAEARNCFQSRQRIASSYRRRNSKASLSLCLCFFCLGFTFLLTHPRTPEIQLMCSTVRTQITKFVFVMAALSLRMARAVQMDRMATV